MQISKNPYPIEKIIACATYLTAGGAGVIWLIIAALMKKQVTVFLRYHIFQSIFLSILFYLVSVFLNLIFIILYRIPFIGAIPYYLNVPLPFAFGLSIFQIFTTLIILYLAITAFMGYYSYLPWVSDVISGKPKK